MLPELESLVTRILTGDEEAWQRFWGAIAPRLDSMLRRPHFLGKLGTSEDHRRDVIVEVLGGLKRDDFARLRAFVAARAENPELPFLAWLAVVTKRIAIDHLRRQDEYEDRRSDPAASTKGRWREFDPLPPDSVLPGAPSGATDRATARELLAFAKELPEAQRQALEGWTRGESFETLARNVGLDTPRDAEKLVRAAVERLRRHFRDGGTA